TLAGNAWHVFGYITDGPYAGNWIQRDSDHGPWITTYDPELGGGTQIASGLLIVNNIVAGGYSLGFNNCSFLMAELTQTIDPRSYPGLNVMTEPSPLPPPGQPMQSEFTTPNGWQVDSILNGHAGFQNPTGTAAQYWYAYAGGMFPAYDESASEFW